MIGNIGRRLRKQSAEAQDRLGALMSQIEETLGGLRIIKAFNAEGYQKERFDGENNAYARLMTRIYRRRDLASPLSEFLGICVVALLLWYGSGRVFAGELSPEVFLTFLYAFYNVIDPAKAFASASYSVRKGLGALDRIERLLQADLRIVDRPDALPIEEIKEGVQFDRVSFQYAGAERPAVDNVSLHIPKGQVIALVGASGAGKSTIADLLPRFHDVTHGRILIDGVIYAICASTTCVASSVWSVKRQCCSTIPYATISYSAARMCARQMSSGPLKPPTRTSSSWRCLKATTPTSAIAAPNSAAANANASPSPARCSKIRRF